MKVRDPHGQEWRVRRRWLPWRRRLRTRFHDLRSSDSPLNEPMTAVEPLLFVALLVPFVLLALLVSLELLLLLLLVPVAALVRVLFGRQWEVEVRRDRRLRWSRPCGTWSQSGRRIEQLAQELRAGHGPPEAGAPTPSGA